MSIDTNVCIHMHLLNIFIFHMLYEQTETTSTHSKSLIPLKNYCLAHTNTSICICTCTCKYECTHKPSTHIQCTCMYTQQGLSIITTQIYMFNAIRSRFIVSKEQHPGNVDNTTGTAALIDLHNLCTLYMCVLREKLTVHPLVLYYTYAKGRALTCTLCMYMYV